MLRPEDIVTFADDLAPEGATPWVGDYEPARDIAIVAYDPSWARAYDALAALVRGALGPAVIELQHVGSTSVPGLSAKPIIDIDLVVADTADEDSYVPALAAAGFVLRVREPWWYGHRCLVHEAPRCNLHVFATDTPEVVRHRIFRDWLRTHSSDRELYSAAKRAAAAEANARGEHVMEYNARKQDVIREIYQRAFRAAGLVTDTHDEETP